MHLDIDAARRTAQQVEPFEPAGLHASIEALARPRLTGTEGAAEVESEIRSRFSDLGYQAEDLPFTASTLPGRFGMPAAGAAMLLTGAGAAALLLADLPLLALLALLAGMALALSVYALSDTAARRLPWRRVEARNLLFTRPDRRPSWILMAHRDSKSQLVPTLVRTVVIVLAVVGWVALVVLAATWSAVELFRVPDVAVGAGATVALAGLLMMLSWSGNDSPGALDNATGLAALLAVAERETSGDVGFLVTDAEELGLLGARAAVDSLPPVQGVINLDGLDDDGTTRVAEGHGLRRSGTAPQLAAGLLTAGRALEIAIERKPLPRSIPVDHIPLAAAGIPAVTVLRGGIRSLGRVHRPSDHPDRLSGRGAAETAGLLTATLALLRESEADHLAAGRGPGS